MLERSHGSTARPIVWRPSHEWIERSQLTAYMGWLHRERGLHFGGYPDLWAWSVTDIEAFWTSIWDYFGVIGEAPRAVALERREMPGTRWFPGTTVNYAEHMFRGRDPRRPAVIQCDEEHAPAACSWGELEELTARVRAGLVRAGVGRGDRVAALLPNRLETVALLLATASLGAVFSCVAPEMGAAAVVDRFSQIEPTVLVCVDGYRYGGRDFDLAPTLERVCAALPTLAQTVVLGSRDWDWFAGSYAPLEFERVPFEHPLWILYSSGTTGPPKAIVHSQGGILLEHLKKLHLHVDLGASDRLFWFTTTGWMMWNFLVSGLLTEATIVLYDGSPKHPDLGSLWEVTAATGTTVFGSSAGYLTACMSDGIDPHRGRDLSALRGVGSTGSPLLGPVFDWVYDRVGSDIWLFSSSGGTDVCTSFIGGVPTLPVRRGELQARSLGAAIEAWDPDGLPLIGTVGELVVTQPMPSMPTCFWGDPDGERLRESYFATYPGVWRHGDWIEITDLGGVVISGRSDSTINRGGVRFGTSEIYQVVLADGDVDDALAVDVSRPDGSSWLPLFVVMRDGVELDDAIRGRLREQLLRDRSPRHLPDEIIAVPEIPRTLSGKPLEVPVKRILMGVAADDAVDRSTLANPASLDPFLALAGADGATAKSTSRATASGRTPRGVAGDRPADGVLRLTIDRPDRRNALDLPLLDELTEQIEATDARCVILRGAGDVFSSGYDLSALDGARDDDWRTRALGLVANPHHAVFDALERSQATIIAQLNGAAIGGGLELAICCDLRFAAATATVAMPAGQLGLAYSHTGLRRFTETIGLSATKELFLLGRRLDAERASRLGIVTQVHSAATLERETLTAAVEIAALSPAAQASNKRILERLRGAGRTLSPQVEAELEAMHRACFTGERLGEGIAAFAQRREPRWDDS